MLRHIGNVMQNATSIVFVSWLSVILVGRVFEFHTEYIAFVDQVASEKWLLDQCNDDNFYHNMAYHTDVCVQVQSNNKISPILYAMNASLANMKMCGFYHCETILSMVYTGGFPVVICCILLYILAPSFLLPIFRSGYERRQERILLKNCSPDIQQSSRRGRTLGSWHDTKYV